MKINLFIKINRFLTMINKIITKYNQTSIKLLLCILNEKALIKIFQFKSKYQFYLINFLYR